MSKHGTVTVTYIASKSHMHASIMKNFEPGPRTMMYSSGWKRVNSVHVSVARGKIEGRLHFNAPP